MTTTGLTATAPTAIGHERGTPGYRRLGAALWCGGLATFVLVHCVQGLLPTLSAEFGVSSSVSSLALSATTGTPALAIVPLSAVAESWGRARVMTWALAASAVLGVLAPLAPTFWARCCCPVVSRGRRRRCTCWRTTRGAASAGRWAGWRSTSATGRLLGALALSLHLRHVPTREGVRPRV